MMQLYFLTMVALVIEALVFLSDYYGWKYILLLKTKNYLLGKRKRLIIVIIIYLILMVCNLFFPVSPGPVLLGEFSVVISLALFVLFTTGVFFSPKENFDEEVREAATPRDFLMMGHSAIEFHKRNLGFAVIIVAAVHLIYPAGILI